MIPVRRETENGNKPFISPLIRQGVSTLPMRPMNQRGDRLDRMHAIEESPEIARFIIVRFAVVAASRHEDAHQPANLAHTAMNLATGLTTYQYTNAHKRADATKAPTQTLSMSHHEVGAASISA